MAQRPRYADFAHQKEPKNLAGPNWATCETGQYFQDGKMNRGSHSEYPGTETRANGLGRTVRVEHYHFRDRGE